MKLPVIFPRNSDEMTREELVREGLKQQQSKRYWLGALAKATVKRPVGCLVKRSNKIRPTSETEVIELPDGSTLRITWKPRREIPHPRDVDVIRQAQLLKLIVDLPRQVPLSTLHVICRRYLDNELGVRPEPIPTIPHIVRPQTLCLCYKMPSPFKENYLDRPEGWERRNSL